MEFDHYLIWFIDSLKTSFDNDIVDDKKLSKNVENCFQRIKKASTATNKDEDFEKLRVKAVLALLLCCPGIKNHAVISTSKDFQLLISNLPNLKECHFLSVIKSQRCYRCLPYVLSYLPPTYLSTVIKEYFAITDGVTPVTLAMSLELFNSFLLSWQSNSCEQDCEPVVLECLSLYVKFLSSKTVSSSSKVLIKSSAYYFMYLTKYFLSVLSIYAGKPVEHPQIPESVESWRSLWRKHITPASPRGSLFVKDIVITLMKLCQKNNEAVNVNLWMEWSEIMLPPSVIPHKGSVSKKAVEKSIQSVICNIAYDITSLFDLHPSLHESLEAGDCQGFMQFMKQVACDPDYDPDYDLSIDQLIQEIELRDDREEKLLEILLNKEGVYTSQECVSCVKNHIPILSLDIRREALLNLICHIKNGSPFIAEWQEFILELAQEIPSKELMFIIVNHLDSGQSEILKTANFGAHSIAIFNQLVGESTPADQEKHIWLCLQSGKEVVHQAVTMPISFPGLVPVMVQTLVSITEVCQAVYESGVSVIANSLQKVQSTGLSGREEKDFGDLVKGLMNRSTLSTKEALHILIEPNMEIKGHQSIEKLSLPLELLKNIADHHLSTLVQTGVQLNSLIISLMYIISNTVILQGPKASIALALRVDAEYIISIIAKEIAENIQLFEKDVSLLKEVVDKQQLNPRSVLPVTNLLESKQCEDSFLDRILFLLNQAEFKRSMQSHLRTDSDDFDLEVSRAEWILVLLQILPHSSESEWVSGMFLTHQFLQSGQVPYQTLRLMQELLQTICAQSTGSSLNDTNEDDDVTCLPSLSIQHCFKCFSSSAMIYVQAVLESHSYANRFEHLCNIFKWWSQTVQLFQWHADLSALFLLKVCLSIEDLVCTRKLKLERAKGNANTTENDSISQDLNVGQENGIANCTGSIVEKKIVKHDSESEPHPPNKNTLLELNDKVFSDKQREMKDDNVMQVGKMEKQPVNKKSIQCDKFCYEINQLIFALVKYVPVSNIAGTIGSKLKNLSELSQ